MPNKQLPPGGQLAKRDQLALRNALLSLFEETGGGSGPEAPFDPFNGGEGSWGWDPFNKAYTVRPGPRRGRDGRGTWTAGAVRPRALIESKVLSRRALPPAAGAAGGGAAKVAAKATGEDLAVQLGGFNKAAAGAGAGGLLSKAGRVLGPAIGAALLVPAIYDMLSGREERDQAYALGMAGGAARTEEARQRIAELGMGGEADYTGALAGIERSFGERSFAPRMDPRLMSLLAGEEARVATIQRPARVGPMEALGMSGML